ncbi:hypothetical protein L2E82_48084 [Cichorium intybus]|uniref:Uncharacterized protein n=1 Tax=Cichorium intybus TaxID=13427 RepID=A0ACB8YXJ0_CICIN|nr:hypothetical protein L2E82_48084 [Cichorium intybus]
MVSPLHVLSRSIKEGGTTFKLTHGDELFDFALINPKFNDMFNEGMACNAKFTMDTIISNYKDGFLGMKGTVVDVGGGTGMAISEIVKAYTHLKGINFDLPHVIATAPTLVLMTAADKTGRVMQKFKCVCPNQRKIIVLDYQDAASRIAAELRGVPDLIIGNYSDGNLVASLLSYKIGVTQFTADLLAMNNADFIITGTYQEIAGMRKWCQSEIVQSLVLEFCISSVLWTIEDQTILHNWSNDDCVKILKNCRKVIPKETGKVILVEIIHHPGQDDPLNDTLFSFDLMMFAYFSNGRERKESEWKKLLNEGGFYRYNIINVPAIVSIIEAFP